MQRRTLWPALVLLLSALLLHGCGTTPRSTPSKTPTPQSSGGYYEDDGPGSAPPNLEQMPDAVPRVERLHKFANQPYTVFGKTYVPSALPAGTRLRGHASWYGRKFHGKPTAIGEPYDMYAMTAAHPTLPLPSYARVSNPSNGRSVIVRINDRGPFLRERVIDLSYTAALKLGFVHQGSAWVEVEPIVAGAAGTANAPVRNPARSGGGHFVQLGAFRDSAAAESFQRRLAAQLEWLAQHLHIAQRAGVARVRAGPYASPREAQLIAERISTSTGLSVLTTGF